MGDITTHEEYQRQYLRNYELTGAACQYALQNAQSSMPAYISQPECEVESAFPTRELGYKEKCTQELPASYGLCLPPIGVRRTEDADDRSKTVIVKTAPSSLALTSDSETEPGDVLKDAHVCNECFKKHSSADRLESHAIRRKHRTYECKTAEGCGKKYSRRDVYYRHIAKHQVQAPHRCLRCGFMCSRKDHLRRHEASVHNLRKPKHKVSHEREDLPSSCIEMELSELMDFKIDVDAITDETYGLEKMSFEEHKEEIKSVEEVADELKDVLGPNHPPVQIMKIGDQLELQKSSPPLQRALARMITVATIYQPDGLPGHTIEKLEPIARKTGLSNDIQQIVASKVSDLMKAETGD